jgi:hypothetical protein
MTRFTFEEINLICCYMADTKAATVAGMKAALPFMESEFTGRTIAKLDKLTEEGFAELSFEPAEDNG